MGCTWLSLNNWFDKLNFNKYCLTQAVNVCVTCTSGQKNEMNWYLHISSDLNYFILAECLEV